MVRIRYTAFGIVLGLVLGFGVAPTLIGATAPTPAIEGAVWTKEHAAIPAPTRYAEPAPTF